MEDKNHFQKLNHSMTKIDLLRRRQLHQMFAGIEIHPRQFPILEYITQHPGCTQVEISEDIGHTPAAITLATQRLQKGEFIKKEADTSNLRRNSLNVTDKGRECLNKAYDAFKNLDNKEFSGFTSEELALFQSFLDRLIKNISGKNSDDISLNDMAKIMDQLHGGCRHKHQ